MLKIQKALAFIMILIVLALAVIYISRPFLSHKNSHHSFFASLSAIGVPVMGKDFGDYIDESRAIIRKSLEAHRFDLEDDPFLGYELEEVVVMRSPYEYRPATDCIIKTGFLLVHGLSDSPYLLSDIAQDLNDNYPCAFIRAIILPGHGTLPGDLLNANHQDWQDAVEFGINSFAGEVDRLIGVGYSTGAGLLGLYQNENKATSPLNGLILLAPGFGVQSAVDFLIPTVAKFKSYVSQTSNHDAAKYASMTMQAASEYYKLTKPYSNKNFDGFNIASLMVISGDESVVKTDLAMDIHCNHSQAPHSHLLWYHSTKPLPDEICEDVILANGHSNEWPVISIAHTAITMRPTNPHYGVNGVIRTCHHLDSKSEDICMTHDGLYYAASDFNIENLPDDSPAPAFYRGSFNPHYDDMMKQIFSFSDEIMAD